MNPTLRCALTLLLLVPTAAYSARWSAYGPDSVTSSDVAVAEVSGSVQRIVYSCDPQRPGAFWCGARQEFSPAVDADTVELVIKSVTQRPLDLKISDGDGRDAYYHLAAPMDWVKVRVRLDGADFYGKPGQPPTKVRAVEFIINNEAFSPGERVEILAGPVTLSKVGRPAPKPILYPNWLPSAIPPPVPGYRIETCIWNVWPPSGAWGSGEAEFHGMDAPGGLELSCGVADNLVREYGNVGMTSGYLKGDNCRKFAEHLASLGGLPLSEGHNNPGKDFVLQHKAYALNIDGRNVWEAGGPDADPEDMTDPVVLEALRGRMMDAAKAGAKAWRTVDYVWQWWGGGVWGYSESAVKRWRENLQETDAGIEVVEDGRHRVARFWEYFESYSGYRMKPSEAGLADWASFCPPRKGEPSSPEADARRRLFNLLFHYEWVKFINEAARPSAPLGLLAQPICNPEGFATGTDLYWLLRCAFVRGFATEWWGPADVIVPNYYNCRYYDNVAARNGKEIIFLGESAAGGGSPFWGAHGRPNYWDNMANYLITYSQSGSVDAKAKHDQYWGSTWATMTDPRGREYQSYTGFRSAWCGFLQCRNDKAVKPRSDVLAIANRAIAGDMDSFDRGGFGQPSNLQRHLVEMNYLHDGAAFPVDGAYRLSDYRTILYTPCDPPRGFSDRLRRWLDVSPNRTLIAHAETPGLADIVGSSVPQSGRPADGVIECADPVLARSLSAFVGKTARIGRAYDVPGGAALVSIAGKPLVTERRCGRGRVICLNFAPEPEQRSDARVGIEPLDRSGCGSELERAVIDGVMRYLGNRPQAMADSSIRALPFALPGDRRAFILFNTRARTDVALKGEPFTVFQARDPEVRGIARLLVGSPEADYVVTDMITGGKERLRSDREGYLSVSYSGWNMRGVYIESAAR